MRTQGFDGGRAVGRPSASLHIGYEHLGLGFFWSWCYCLWFIPQVHTAPVPGMQASQNMLWLITMAAAAVLHFAIPALLGEKHRLSSLGFLYWLAPLSMSVGTVVLEIAIVYELPLGLCCAISVLLGASSATLWNLWGEFYASSKGEIARKVAPSFAITIIASVTVGSLMPAVPANILVTLLPSFSWICLRRARRIQGHSPFPPLLPADTRRMGWRTVLEVCVVFCIACIATTFLWTVIPGRGLYIGGQAMAIGVICGGTVMLLLSAILLLFPRRFNLSMLFPWLLIAGISAFSLFLLDDSLSYASYLAAMVVSVLLDVFLVIYFGTFTSKGYVRPSISFGYSEGFICVGMVVGSLLGIWASDVTRASPWVLNAVCIGFMFIQACLLIPLLRREYEMAVVMSEVPDVATIEKICIGIAEEHGLTEREVDIFKLLAKGYSAESIARKLTLSVFTVNTHIKHIYTKLGIHKRSELMSYVRRQSEEY